VSGLDGEEMCVGHDATLAMRCRVSNDGAGMAGLKKGRSKK